MTDYVDRRVTPPKRVTSPTQGPHLHVNMPLVVKRRHRANGLLSAAHVTLTCFIHSDGMLLAVSSYYVLFCNNDWQLSSVQK